MGGNLSAALWQSMEQSLAVNEAVIMMVSEHLHRLNGKPIVVVSDLNFNLHYAGSILALENSCERLRLQFS